MDFWLVFLMYVEEKQVHYQESLSAEIELLVRERPVTLLGLTAAA